MHIMFEWKDRVSNKLSRRFTNSPNSSPSGSSECSSPQNNNSQARPHSRGRKSFSSLFPFTLPFLSFPGSRPNKNQQDLTQVQSLHVRWNTKDFQQQEEYLARYHECNTICRNEEYQKYGEDDRKCGAVCDKNQTIKTHNTNGDGASGRSSSDGDLFEEALDQQTPGRPLPNLMDESVFISSHLYEFLQSSLPHIVKGCQWVLLYSTLKHGISLRTLIRKSTDLTGPCLLIVGDRQGAVFGGLLECPLKPTGMRKYQGTNQSFVFTTIYGEPRLFRPTGANRYYYLCLDDILALGGGGNFALRLDGDLLNGTSGPCETFGNLCLAHKPEFELKNVELWGFTYSSKYLA